MNTQTPGLSEGAGEELVTSRWHALSQGDGGDDDSDDGLVSHQQ